MPLGLYLHVPFCDGKCPYCDFYSLRGDEGQMDAYVEVACRELARWGRALSRPADTLYFGGGTPSLLGEARLIRLVEAARRAFGLQNVEITVEVNPTRGKGLDFSALRDCGINRLSIGLQSADEGELAALGRRHSAADARAAVRAAQRAGFDNLSLDLMLAVPGQTEGSLAASVDFCRDCGVQHVSAYLLKLEEGTPFFDRREALSLPDEDGQADRYLLACSLLERAGFEQYEISNFCLPGRESRHNLKYWDGAEYLGIGPSAHSFLNGERFYTPRELFSFLREPAYVPDGPGGDEEEYAMLRLRLTKGLTEADFIRRFGREIPARWRQNARRYQPGGLLVCDREGIRFTKEGFLLSNQLIAEVIL